MNNEYMSFLNISGENVKKFLAIAFVMLPLLASCTSPATTGGADPTPTETTASASPTPTPDPTPTLGVRRWVDPETPPPLPELSDEQRAKFGDCLDKNVYNGTKGTCAKLLQEELKTLGFYQGTINSRTNVAVTNAVHRYQRSRNLKPTGVVGQQTWYALASGQPARSTELPEECKLDGVVLCVDQGRQEMKYVKNGEVIKTIEVRTGGYTTEPKTGKWRIHATANGLFKVYNKHVNPHSENYGSGVMPYSVMFDPNMYVHYSSDFKRWGYSRSSHGCVNIRDLDQAKWVFKNTPIGAHVYVW